MFSSTLLLTSLVALTSALPTSSTLSPRAGGPVSVPIPSSCKIIDPLASASVDDTFLPGPSTSDVLLYSAYYPSPTSNITALFQQCLEQCYGYGNLGECKSVFWGENVPVPAGYYGSPGGQLETACLFYTRALEREDFVIAPDGQATTMVAGNIEC